MAKQIITALLIPILFLYLTGCYSMYDIPREDFTKEDIYKKAQKSDLRVVKNNGESFLFRAYTFTVRNDTLLSFINEKISENRSTVQTNIPLKDISTFQTEKLNGLTTTFFVVGFIAVLAVLASYLYVALLNDVVDHSIKGN